MSSRLLAFRSLGPAFLLTLCGCGGGPDEAIEPKTGRIEQPIAGGYIDPESTAVVGIYDPAHDVCTGALIAPNVVLTARHCVSAVYGQPQSNEEFCAVSKVGPLRSASSFYITTHTTFPQALGEYHQAREVIGPPNESDLVCGNDIAILILDAPIEAAEAAPLVPRVDVPIGGGESYSALGFGAINGADEGVGVRRRRDELVAHCVGGACPPPLAPLYLEIKETEWRGDAGACDGDSGGPAIDSEGRVVGVTSRGEPGCATPVYGHTFSWGTWIKEVTIYAAGLGGYAPPPWVNGWPTDPAYSRPVGGACASDAECPSSLCLHSDVAGYCSRACNAASPCPFGYTCDGIGVCQRSVATDSAADETGACAVRSARADPTKPVPWKTCAAALGGLGALLLRRRRRRGKASPA